MAAMAVTKVHRNLLVVASVTTLLLIIMGGVVCITGASKGCPDWPGCYGRALPPTQLDSILEYTHRVLAALATLLIVASAVAGWLRTRAIRWVSWPPIIAIFFLVAVIIFGAMVVLRGLERGLAALDLGSALIVLALMLAATLAAHRLYRNPGGTIMPSLRNPLAQLAFAAMISVYAVLVTGVLVAPDGSTVRCLSWPLYGGAAGLESVSAWLHVARHFLAGIGAIMIVGALIQAWRDRAAPPPARATAALTGGLFVLELGIGAAVVWFGGPVLLQILYVAAAALLWASLVILTLQTSFSPRAAAKDSMPS
jgi:cytochrome c oxidase assembly protein subunit 15